MRLAALAALLIVCTPALGASDQEALDALVAAYPRQLKSHDGKTLYWRDGTAMPVDDSKPGKSFDEMLRGVSILDQFRIPYPKGETRAPSQNEDPGRFRNAAFFRKMYGDCQRGSVTGKMVSIVWLPKSWGKPVRVTSVNDIAQKLVEISNEIEKLPPNIRRAAFPIAGVYSCRPVADTGQMSMHAYAAAIDLNLAVSDYWFWQKQKGDPIPYKSRMPREIVDIFERHGFIWGGRWYHYDTMHFEYRPELLGLTAR
jgi:hypothetical protein